MKQYDETGPSRKEGRRAQKRVQIQKRRSQRREPQDLDLRSPSGRKVHSW